MTSKERLRRMIPGAITLLVAASMFGGVTVAHSAPDGDSVASAGYSFKSMPIAMPPGYDQQKMKNLRVVNPNYEHIRSWISAIGASIAINDLTGNGLSDGMCVIDTRTDSVIVTYTPTAPARDRFTPFTLTGKSLPMDKAMAPTVCTPGDFNGDGRMDLLVSYWGRTPIVYLARAGFDTLSESAYKAVEVVPNGSPDGKYRGPRWNTDATYVGDLDGDGHPDIIQGNYFPDSDVLDPNGLKNTVMNSSLSSAVNSGGDRVLRWYSATSGANPTAAFVEEKEAIPFKSATGWTLAMAGGDLTGDSLPEVYIANDFGHDHLLYNMSSPGRIRFKVTKGERTPTTPKSFVLGNDSFKGMGVDFADLNQAGKLDIFVSNIDQAWGLVEGNFAFMNQTDSQQEMASKLAKGKAPFTQQALSMGLAFTGWSWDVKTGDFLNQGRLDVVQADGFLRGKTDRWAWLQELAMTNDNLISTPKMWPKFEPGDDLSGRNVVAFYARNGDRGKYVNISKKLGITEDTPSRAIATADTTGSGLLDFAVGYQWGPPLFFSNTAEKSGNFLDFNLYRPSTGSEKAGTDRVGLGSPAYNASVTVTTPKGTQRSDLDGGSGHSGLRSFGVHFGLGDYAGPATVTLQWRDSGGALHKQTQKFTPGTHNLMLTDQIQEVSAR